MHSYFPQLPYCIKTGEVRGSADAGYVFAPKITLDSGASAGNYVGRSFLGVIVGAIILKCEHKAKLGDGKTRLHITEAVKLKLRLFGPNKTLGDEKDLGFYVLWKMN